MILDSTSRPFFTTDAAVSSQELSIAKINTSFSSLISIPRLSIYENTNSIERPSFAATASGKISLTSFMYSSGLVNDGL